MKTIITLFILTFLMGCSENNVFEIGQKTTMKVKPVYDAGKVLLGEEVEAIFEVKNTGEYPLVISEIKGSCSCTVVDRPEKPIAPGKSEKIKATVKTESANLGSLVKEVRITANTEPSLTVLKINAEVISK